MADSDQRREFLVEIQLMKNIGSHKNIVNMLGCCSVQEPMFLLVEYVPYGDLLHYLRKRREKVESNPNRCITYLKFTRPALFDSCVLIHVLRQLDGAPSEI